MRTVATTIGALVLFASSGCVSSSTYDQLRRDHDQMMTQCSGQNAQVGSASAQLAQLTSENQSFRQQLSLAQQAQGNTSGQLSQLMSENQSLRQQLGAAQAQVEQLRRIAHQAIGRGTQPAGYSTPTPGFAPAPPPTYPPMP
jgi:chromosome segregation ATPase